VTVIVEAADAAGPVLALKLMIFFNIKIAQEARRIATRRRNPARQRRVAAVRPAGLSTGSTPHL
jgi:hypothetical protein